MTEKINTAGMEKATGRSFAAWRALLDEAGARDLDHAAIARIVLATGGASGWWAQGITVAYEQAIGRRKPGQVADGSFQTSVSKTMSGTKEARIADWSDYFMKIAESEALAPAREPETSHTGKWCYWRAGLEDGSRLVVSVTEKSPDKCLLTIAHERIGNAEAAETWRAFWKRCLNHLA